LTPLERVRELAERVATSYGLDIFDVELKREGGQLSITTGAFQVTMVERQEKFLFIKWHSKGVKVWGSATKASFNRKLYDEVRETVKLKLGKHARQAIAELPLALD